MERGDGWRQIMAERSEEVKENENNFREGEERLKEERENIQSTRHNQYVVGDKFKGKRGIGCGG